MRPALAGLKRYIATAETSKHRVFQFLNSSILPDNKLIAICADDAFILGVISSRFHTVWSLRAGGWIGAGNDSVYVKSQCFDPYPFPEVSSAQRRDIQQLAEELDALRKSVLAEYPDLTLTALYNALSAIILGTALDSKQQDTVERGRVRTLRDLHEQIDLAVASAYRWSANIETRRFYQI
ncbi:hypothetical protein [Tardiphaga sp.]|uniref:hypothetical protein n=1 Tax=Tardiphaga sp. TaxID=1926292 RepID=UPI00352A3950